MSKIEEIRDVIVPVLAPYVTEIALFGSVVRGDDTTESDIDILVTFKKPVGFFTLVDLEEKLAHEIGRPVDLVTEGSISRYIRPYVEKDKVVIYELEN